MNNNPESVPESTVESLGEALPREMARVRDVLLPHYDAIPTGVFASALMRADLDRAARAMAEGDTVEMMRAYESLRCYKE